MQQFHFDSGGVRLHAFEAGAGHPVLVIHGGMADHRAAQPYTAPLATRCRVIAPDLRGSGRSRFAGELSYALLAADMGALLDHLGLAEAVVVGISGGTAVAAAFALSEPSRVRAFAAVMPCFPGADPGFTPEQRAIFAGMDALASRAPAEGIDVVRPLYAQAPEPYREAAIAMAMEYDPASLAATSRLLASGAQPFATASDLRRLTMPSLVVRADDPVHPRFVSDEWAANLFNCTTVEASDPAHVQVLVDFCVRSARQQPSAG